MGVRAHRIGGVPFFVIAFCLFVLSIVWALAVYLNNGALTYSLDDPYIHLKLASNIAQHHYGFNFGEYSSPSSSIIWPYLVALFSSWVYFPLILNVFFAIFSAVFVVRVLERSVAGVSSNFKSAIILITAITVILATNVLGVVFTGMEHGLQIMLTAALVYGMILVSDDPRTISWWFVAAIVLAPLVRYECISVSISAILVLFYFKKYIHALACALVLIFVLSGFSAYLSNMGLPYLPLSVMNKTGASGSGLPLDALKRGLAASLKEPRANLLLYLEASLLSLILISRGIKSGKMLIGLTSLIVVLAHLVAGKYGWMSRYENYALMYVILLILYFSAPIFVRLFENTGRYAVLRAVSVSLVLLIVLFWRYTSALLVTPLSMNNIFQQQYQMHRFAVEFYKKPVAVNDIGLVGYENNNYVLDLWGLASRDALNARMSGAGVGWMSELASKNNVKLAMIFDEWFPELPHDWKKVGVLRFQRPNVIVASKAVAFYEIGEPDPLLQQSLLTFSSQLPAGVTFEFIN